MIDLTYGASILCAFTVGYCAALRPSLVLVWAPILALWVIAHYVWLHRAYRIAFDKGQVAGIDSSIAIAQRVLDVEPDGNESDPTQS